MSAFAFAWAAKSGGGSYRRSSSRIVSMACVVVVIRYASVRRGIGESRRDRNGSRPHGEGQTGRIALGDIPLITPAAEAYQAVAAVTTPAQPPALIQPTSAPVGATPRCAAIQKPIASRISVISSVRKTASTAPLTRRLQKSMYVLKIANENKNHPSALERSLTCAASWPLKVATKKPSASQKPP